MRRIVPYIFDLKKIPRVTPDRVEADPSHNAEKIARDCDLRRADLLTPHHDSQFSAFSTEALAQLNWGAIAVVLPVLP